MEPEQLCLDAFEGHQNTHAGSPCTCIHLENHHVVAAILNSTSATSGNETSSGNFSICLKLFGLQFSLFD